MHDSAPDALGGQVLPSLERLGSTFPIVNHDRRVGSLHLPDVVRDDEIEVCLLQEGEGLLLQLCRPNPGLGLEADEGVLRVLSEGREDLRRGFQLQGDRPPPARDLARRLARSEIGDRRGHDADVRLRPRRELGEIRKKYGVR